MSLTNYTDLQAAIAAWMVRSDLTAVIPDFITLFEAEANRVLRTRAQETAGTVTMSSGSGTLPTDYLGWKRLTWTGSPVMELEYVHPDWLKAAYPTTPSGIPKVWTIEGGSIKIAPVDDTSLSFLYYAKVPALSTGTNWLMSAHPDLYLYGALGEGWAYLLDTEKAALCFARRDAMFESLNRLDMHTRGPSAPRIAGVVV
jgi:hypothetical protein